MAHHERRRAAARARRAARRRPRRAARAAASTSSPSRASRPSRRASSSVVAQVGRRGSGRAPTPRPARVPSASAPCARSTRAAAARRRADLLASPSQPTIARQPPPCRAPQVAAQRRVADARRRPAPARRGLLLVGQARDVGRDAAPARARGSASTPVGERRAATSPRSAAGRARGRTRSVDRGDHAERPLGADEQLAQVGPGGLAGAAAASSVARRRHDRAARRRARRSARSRSTPGPAERVAAKPPTVAYSNDCGKWPSVSPRRAEQRLGLGAAQARLEPREQRARRRASSSRSSRARSRATHAVCAPRSGSTPPTTHVPPPNGTTATPACGAGPQRPRRPASGRAG